MKSDNGLESGLSSTDFPSRTKRDPPPAVLPSFRGAPQFLSEDPVGIAGGLNLYSYAGNDPLNHRDPSGQMWCGGALDLYPCESSDAWGGGGGGSCQGWVFIRDGVEVPCDDDLLNTLNGWFNDNLDISLGYAMGQSGTTMYYANGTQEDVCPESFGDHDWMCQKITDALVTLISSHNSERGEVCQTYGLELNDRFVNGQFQLITGYIYHGNKAYVGHPKDGVIQLSTRDFNPHRNLAFGLAHEEAHIDLNVPGSVFESAPDAVARTCAGPEFLP